jgi:hypothetical protein
MSFSILDARFLVCTIDKAQIRHVHLLVDAFHADGLLTKQLRILNALCSLLFSARQDILITLAVVISLDQGNIFSDKIQFNSSRHVYNTLRSWTAISQ